MKRDYQIDIDGYISGYGSSKYYVKECLKKHPEAINIRINSPGGSVDHGLDIMEQLRCHGNVTAYIFGMTASSATIIAMGAQKVCMSRSALMLVHRCSVPVVVWQTMNEQQIADLIKSLEKDQANTQTIDQVIASLYAKKTGKSMDEVKDLMTKAKWLNAEECKKIGLVDEIIDDGDAPVITNAMIDKFNACGIPVPTIQDPAEEPTDTDKNLFGRFINFLKREKETDSLENKKEPINNQPTSKMKIFNKVIAALCLTTIAANEQGKFEMTEDELDKLENQLNKDAQDIAKKDGEIKDLKTEVENLKTKLKESEAPVDTVPSTGDTKKEDDTEGLSSEEMFNLLED